MWWIVLLLQSEATGFDLATLSRSGKRPGCAAGSEEIVVCGGRPDRYRLPLRDERDVADRRRGDSLTGAAALTSPAPCGIFAGERRCTKAEAARYGYGSGRDPITVVGKLVGAIVHPDD